MLSHISALQASRCLHPCTRHSVTTLQAHQPQNKSSPEMIEMLIMRDRVSAIALSTLTKRSARRTDTTAM